MNAKRLLSAYERIADAPGAVARLRRFVLDLAVRGKLVPEDPNDEPAAELLKRIAIEKARLVKIGDLRKPRELDNGSELNEPFAIPATWRWVRFDTVGAIVGGGTPSATDADNFSEPGEGMPWLTPADLGGYANLYISRGARDLSEKGLRTSSATVMPKGTVLFTSRAPIGYVAIAANPISTNQGFKSVVPYVVDCSRFIATALKAFATEIDAKAPGTTFKEVSAKIVAAIPFPLPPLAEQHRIVAKVDELIALCDRLEAARAAREATRDKLTATSLTRLNAPNPETFQADVRFALDALPVLTARADQITQLRQTVLNLAVRGKLVPQDPNDESASELLARLAATKSKGRKGRDWSQGANSHHAPEFEPPLGWSWTTIDETAHRVTVGYVGPMRDQYVADGMPFLRSQNVRANKFREEGLIYISPGFHQKIIKSALAPGDVVVVRSGNVGTACVIPPTIKEANCSDLVVIQKPECVLPEFLCFYLNSLASAHVEAGSVGVALTHFNKIRGDYAFGSPSPRRTTPHRCQGRCADGAVRPAGGEPCHCRRHPPPPARCAARRGPGAGRRARTGGGGMSEPRLYNVYCDESCHLEHDGFPVMAWGAVTCPEGEVRAIGDAIRALKAAHGLKPGFEAKWTKVSPAKVGFYLALIDLFLGDERLRFRGLLVPDKARLDHARFDQSHDDWYYKMYFTMLRPIFTAPHRYRIYLDVKDTRGGPKTRKYGTRHPGFCGKSHADRRAPARRQILRPIRHFTDPHGNPGRSGARAPNWGPTVPCVKEAQGDRRILAAGRPRLHGETGR